MRPTRPVATEGRRVACSQYLHGHRTPQKWNACYARLCHQAHWRRPSPWVASTPTPVTQPCQTCCCLAAYVSCPSFRSLGTPEAQTRDGAHGIDPPLQNGFAQLITIYRPVKLSKELNTSFPMQSQYHAKRQASLRSTLSHVDQLQSPTNSAPLSGRGFSL